jgi:hypothetical protein
MTAPTFRLVPHWPNALSNLGWCLWAAGMCAAYEKTMAPMTAMEVIEASEPREIRRRAEIMHTVVARIVAVLPQPYAWRLEGPPDAIEEAWQHLRSIGVKA